MRVTLESLGALHLMAACRAGQLTDKQLAERLGQGVPRLRALVDAYARNVKGLKR